jgi:hypothetical protein
MKTCVDFKWLDGVIMEKLHVWAMVKVAWLAALMDDHCSSFDEDGDWMLVWHRLHGDGIMECTRKKVYL